MSFASDVKAEVSQNELKDCCKKAELAAMIQICSSLSIGSNGLSLNIKTENPTIGKRIYSLVKDIYHVKPEILVYKKTTLKKKNTYSFQVNEEVRNILTDLTILGEDGLRYHPLSEIVKKECCARAYLAGAFMASGSVNSPQTTAYHLEIVALNENHAKYIQKLMSRFYLNAKITQRRQQYVVYIKASEQISDFLRCIGAHDCVMSFEDVRIQRDFVNSFQRLNNCELANEVKTLEAGRKQLESIELLEKMDQVRHLDYRLTEIIELRKNNPESSLSELCEIYENETGVEITKSGMKHRLAKIVEIANKIKENQ